MSHDNLSQISGGGTPSINPAEAANFGPVNASLAAFLASTLSPSQQSQVQDSRDMQNPAIMEPNWALIFNSSPTISVDSATQAFALKVNTRLNEICLDMLEQWNDDIKKQIAEKKAYDNSAEGKRKEEERHDLNHFLGAYISSAKAHEDPYIPMMTVGIVFAATGGGVREAMMIDSESTKMVGVNPTQDQAANPYFFMPDMRAELGLLGAALLQGAAYFANASSIGKGVAKAPAEEMTAKNYAELIETLVRSGDLTKMAMALLTSKTAAGEGLPKNINQLVSQLKLILLLTALAGLYKSGTGHFISGDMAGLISGENKTFGSNKDLMDKLLTFIHKELTDLPKQTKADLLAVMFRFFDQDPELKILTNPSKIFSRLNRQIETERDTPA